MPNKREFRTDIIMNGKANPSVTRSANTVCKALGTIKNTMLSTVGIVSAGAIVAAVKTMGMSFLEAASDMTETQGKINQVFGSSTNVVEKWSKTSIKSMGLAQQTALDSAALYGDMATGMNIPRKKAAEMAMTLTKLGADMASFKNISGDMAQTALKSVFTGETESLKGLGIVMTQAQLQEYAHSKGIKKKIKDMKESEMVMLRYNFVLSKTKNSQGDFARTSMNAANQQRMYNEQIKEMQTRLGNIILPYYTQALQTINKFLVDNGDTIVSIFDRAVKGCVAFTQSIGAVITFVQTYGVPIFAALSGIISGMATYKAIQGFQMLQVQMALASKEAGILGMVANGNLLGAMQGMAVSVWGWVRATWAAAAANGVLNTVMKASVVGLVVAGIVLLWQNWDKVTAAVQRAIQAVKNFFHIKGNNNVPAAKPPAAKPVTKHNALGSKNFVGGDTWVGEHGPEKVRLPRGSEILSNNKSMNQSGDGSIGNMTFNITIKGNADGSVVKNAVSSTIPNIKQQIDAYFREKQRKGLAFA